MERKQFISHLLVGGSGMLIGSAFLYSCLKTNKDLPYPTSQPAPVKTGDVYLLASGISLIHDERLEKQFHCNQVATGTLLSIIRKAPFPFSRQLLRKSNVQAAARGRVKPYTVSYHYSQGLSCEYSITDVSNLRTTIKVPVFSGNAGNGYPVIRILDPQELDKWFDAAMINKITNT
jgi:hypothetical protein